MTSHLSSHFQVVALHEEDGVISNTSISIVLIRAGGRGGRRICVIVSIIMMISFDLKIVLQALSISSKSILRIKLAARNVANP